MSVCRLFRLSVLTFKRCNSLNSGLVNKTNLCPSRKYTSESFERDRDGNTWFKFWRWYFIPLGVGVSLLTVLTWKNFRQKPESKKSNVARHVIVDCYCHLPLRITSRIWGWIANIELPKSLRPILYKFYAKLFSADLEEIDLDLSSFPSLSDFFVRPLKKDARIIADCTNIVSPSDGHILHIGPVTSCRVEQVKGVTYDLRHFLGDTNQPDQNSTTDTELRDAYTSSLLKNPSNQLFQLSVYLAPGDYHRFHSPTDWMINVRRHFQGKLLSVNPAISSWVPNLFSLNERAIYIGEWACGFMAYGVVGATNVGSITVFCDTNLVTNKKKWPANKQCEEAKFDNVKVEKGELFGEFRMGSTIVLLFEAPKDFKFSVKEGQEIKFGEALSNCFVTTQGAFKMHKSAFKTECL